MRVYICEVTGLHTGARLGTHGEHIALGESQLRPRLFQDSFGFILERTVCARVCMLVEGASGILFARAYCDEIVYNGAGGQEEIT